MRVVQVANFYGPRSGGLRTAVDRLGAEYCASGHEVFLIVPGRAPNDTSYARVLFELPCPPSIFHIPVVIARLCQEPCGLYWKHCDQTP